MTLIITVIAAVVATIVWYANDNRDSYKLGTLSLIYWGASLMWLVDFIAEYKELRGEYFVEFISNALADSLLAVAVVTLGLVIWLVILLIKDPKGVFTEKFTKK